MLTTAEKRFIKYWEEQRAGGKAKYYLLYMIAGTFIAVLVLSFLYSIMFAKAFRIDVAFFSIIFISFFLVTILTVFSWAKNEKKFKTIIKREIREGQEKDAGGEDKRSV